MINIEIINIKDIKKLNIILSIRKAVFIDEQGVLISEEIDQYDQDVNTKYYLLNYDNVAVGTARVRYIDKKAKIERVAILKSHRKLGLGHALIKFIINNIKNNNIKKIILSAQTRSIDFYQKLGFEITSEEYLDARILHQDMVLDL